MAKESGSQLVPSMNLDMAVLTLRHRFQVQWDATEKAFQVQ